MTCDIFTSADQVFTSLAIHARMQPQWTESLYYHGWGTARGGWWKPGRYRVECEYGGRLIGRDWFEVGSGGGGSYQVSCEEGRMVLGQSRFEMG